jgi:carboxymethylenebutenolidase
MASRKVKFSSANVLGDAEGVVIGDPSVHPRGLIVIHEWWGMNQQIQDEGADIARNGELTVLVIDMYRGKVAIDREEAGHYMQGLDWEGAVQDLAAGATYLKSIGCTKVSKYTLGYEYYVVTLRIRLFCKYA